MLSDTCIPAELLARPQWVLYRLEERDGKRTKVPYQASRPSARADATDPGTWSAYAAAAKAASAAGADGIGYVFAPDDPFAGVDLDSCVDGEGKVDARAAALVLALDSYTEISASGYGLHVYVAAALNGGRRRTSKTPWGGAFESYDAGRFFCVTGRHLKGTPTTINPRQDRLAEVRAIVFPPEQQQKPAPVITATADDHELLVLARNAKHGERFDALYAGRLDGYGSQSEADLALANMLAFWVGPDAARIDGLFRGSGLMREKWDESRGESTYGAQTIARALEGRTDFYRPHGATTIENASAVVVEVPALSILLDRTEAFLRRYVALSEAQYIALSVWVAHAHALEATSTTPYLHVTSPEAESGKSRLLECFEPLTPRPLYAASMTPAVLFRAVQKLTPTLLVDEADNQMRDRETKGELLALFNAGYRRGAKAYRIGGKNRDDLQDFETFCAKVIAGLDDLVATLASRCLRIEMRRRGSEEHVSDFFRQEAHAEAEPIRDALAIWGEQATEELRGARPDRLGVRDRLEEALRLLVAIGELAGERWGTRTREALRELAGAKVDGALSERIQLLTDVRQVFESHGNPSEITTADLLAGLIGLDEAPWRGWWGVEHRKDDELQVIPSKGAASKLSAKISPFKIKSRDIGPKEKRRKGYALADFADTWRRYLEPSPDPEPRTSRTPHGEAKTETSQAAHHDGGCAGQDGPQTRIAEPSARGARTERGEQA